MTRAVWVKQQHQGEGMSRRHCLEETLACRKRHRTHSSTAVKYEVVWVVSCFRHSVVQMSAWVHSCYCSGSIWAEEQALEAELQVHQVQRPTRSCYPHDRRSYSVRRPRGTPSHQTSRKPTVDSKAAHCCGEKSGQGSAIRRKVQRLEAPRSRQGQP